MDTMTPYTDPWTHFDAWFAEARATERYPEAVNLATADAEGRPSCRIVLVRSWSAEGFVLFTDRESRKGGDLAANPNAALCWHWPSSPAPGLGREIRAQGRVELLEDGASDEYWRGRPRASQVAATTSHQSQPIASREELERRYAEVDEGAGESPPRPERWGGYLIVPDRIEFWAHHDDRLHDRLLYVRDDDGWTTSVLQP
jgi:pyridoxamine 5'-phosphate oxidase